MNRQYIVTERAHYMCPNMHFGILFTVKGRYESTKMEETMRCLQHVHPFLRALIQEESDGRLFYDVQENMEISCIEKETIETLETDYQNISEKGWDVTQEGLLQVLVYPAEEDFTVLFVAHHLLGDGRGILGLVQEFADCYVTGKQPSYVEEQLMTSLADLPKGSDLPWISKLIIGGANRNWKREKQKVFPKDFLDFEKEFCKQNPMQLHFGTKSEQKVQAMLDICHANGFSMNDYLIAQMMKNESVHKVVMAADIRKYLSTYREGSLGNFATAFGVVCKSKTDDTVILAKEVHTEVQNIMQTPNRLMLVLACYLRMNPELLDAVPISTLGSFQSKAGQFVGANMFGYKERNGYSITNLGQIKSETIKEATFIPPASPANKNTTGVLTVNGKMQICSVTCGANVENF